RTFRQRARRRRRLAPCTPCLVLPALDRDLSGQRALAWCRLLRPLARSPSSKGAARRCVDALVAVVPADPIARRGIASEYSSTTPERDRRSVDSDSATTCLPTSKAIATPRRSCSSRANPAGRKVPPPAALHGRVV